MSPHDFIPADEHNVITCQFKRYRLGFAPKTCPYPAKFVVSDYPNKGDERFYCGTHTMGWRANNPSRVRPFTPLKAQA